jgi:YgiT-type zinc finger domain-containing protein
MMCLICRVGEVRQGTTTITLERDGATLVFKNVPARVCENCGEAYVDEEISRQVLLAAEQAVQAGVQVDVREFVRVVV